MREPSELNLSAEIDVAVRPVDLKGMATSGHSDPSDRYWQDLCHCCGVDDDQLPWTKSFVDRQRIKASYNGGLAVVRGNLGILRRWADFFFESIRRGLRPYSDRRTFRSGAGWVEPAAANLWGSNQAALSLAIWSTTRRVRELSPTYNYPLHLHDQIRASQVRTIFRKLVHVHYHWLFAPDSLPTNPLFLPSSPLSPAQQEWLRDAVARSASW